MTTMHQCKESVLAGVEHCAMHSIDPMIIDLNYLGHRKQAVVTHVNVEEVSWWKVHSSLCV